MPKRIARRGEGERIGAPGSGHVPGGVSMDQWKQGLREYNPTQNSRVMATRIKTFRYGFAFVPFSFS